MKMLLIIICLSILFVASAFAQTSYPMTCVFDDSQNVSITLKVYNSAPDHGIAVKFFRITN